MLQQDGGFMKKLILITIIMISVVLSADLKFGIGLFQDGLYEEAVLEFENIIDAAPTSSDAQEAIFWIGECYQARKLYTEAEDSYRRLLEGYPNSNIKDRTIAALAKLNYEQGKYSKAIELYQQLLDKYPLGESTKSSLGEYVDSFYRLEDYNSVILKANRILNDYEKAASAGSVALTLAKAYFASNQVSEGDKLLVEIPQKYPFQNARWDAEKLRINRLEQREGITPAVLLLKDVLKQDIPRSYDETLRVKLVEYQFRTEAYGPAANELAVILQKFSNSDKVDFYITRFAEANIELQRYEIIPDMYFENEKIFKESEYKTQIQLYVAEAYLQTNQYTDAAMLLDEVKKSSSESLRLDGKFLQSEVYEQEGKYRLALEGYRYLLNSSFPGKGLVLYKTANIYFEHFENFSAAAKYYQQIVTSYPESEFYYPSYYKTAICYEALNKIEDAVAELQQVKLSDVADEKLRNKIEQKRSYLLKFKQKNYDTAFDKLLSSVFAYLQNDNRDKLQQDIIDIYAYDLKEFNRSLGLIETADRPDLAYKKAGLLLGLAEQKKAEAKDFSSTLQEVNEIIASLDEALMAEWIAELKLKRDLLSDKEDMGMYLQMEDFVGNYPNAIAANEFLYRLFNYHKNENIDKAAVYADKMEMAGVADISTYYQTKIELAEYYYGKDNDAAALENYRKADDQVTLQYPQIYFHYAVILDQSGYSSEAENRLDLLVKNAQNFSDLKNAIEYYSRRLREKEQFAKAVDIQLLIPQDQRDDDFYLALANDYAVLENKEEAKISLLRIQNKDNATLEKLGLLQMDTGELSMAKYTFEELIDKDPEELSYRENLGRVEFEAENYLEAAENFKVVYTKLGDNLSSYSNVEQFAKDYVISLYRIENRPKAETVSKKVAKLITNETKDEIKLNEAAYYSKIDAKKSEKLLTSLIKKNSSLTAEAHFWRGIAFAKQKKSAEAEADFKIAVKEGDLVLQNRANLKLGTINFTNDKYQEALGFYYKVIENDKQGDLARDAAQNFAYVCKVLEKWQDAVAAYEIILERWGEQGLNSETVFNIAFCHFRDKKYDKAVDMFGQALDILEDKEMRAEAQYWIGESHFGAEEWESAISELLKVGYNYPEFTQWAASADLKAGEAYVRSGKPSKAKRIFERVIDKYGAGSRWGGEAKRQIESL